MFTNHIRHNKFLIFSLVVVAEMEDWQARKHAEYSVYEEQIYLGFLCTLYVVQYYTPATTKLQHVLNEGPSLT